MSATSSAPNHVLNLGGTVNVFFERTGSSRQFTVRPNEGQYLVIYDESHIEIVNLTPSQLPELIAPSNETYSQSIQRSMRLSTRAHAMFPLATTTLCGGSNLNLYCGALRRQSATLER